MTKRTGALPGMTVAAIGLAALLGAGPVLGQTSGQEQNAGQSNAPPNQVLPSVPLSDSSVGLNVPSATLQPGDFVPEVPDSYQIGKNDLLSIFVYQMPELTTQTRVDPAGTIHLPMVPQAIPAANFTSRQLQQQIARALVSNGLARSPQVQVLVRQVASRTVVVSGAVQAPVVLEAWRPMTVLEVLSRAGGVTQQAGSTVLVTTPTDQGMQTQSLAVDDLLRGVGPDPLLTGHDTVRVIPARLIYTVGAVKQPGAFPLRPGEPLSVMKALALSQGLGTSPNLHHSQIIRQGAEGAQEIPVDLRKILDHKSPDVTLEAGDILYVPEDGKRKALGTILTDAGQIAIISVGYGTSSRIF